MVHPPDLGVLESASSVEADPGQLLADGNGERCPALRWMFFSRDLDALRRGGSRARGRAWIRASRETRTEQDHRWHAARAGRTGIAPMTTRAPRAQGARLLQPPALYLLGFGALLLGSPLEALLGDATARLLACLAFNGAIYAVLRVSLAFGARGPRCLAGCRHRAAHRLALRARRELLVSPWGRRCGRRGRCLLGGAAVSRARVRLCHPALRTLGRPRLEQPLLCERPSARHSRGRPPLVHLPRPGRPAAGRSPAACGQTSTETARWPSTSE